MANVNIKFNGKEFLLSCDDGQEEHLEELLTHINEKFNKIEKYKSLFPYLYWAEKISCTKFNNFFL